MQSKQTQTAGLIYALIAYSWWGVVPVYYFKAIQHVPTPEVLAHRILWSLPVLLVLLACLRQLRGFLNCVRNWTMMRWLLLTTALIALNWFVYMYSVVSDQIVQSSLGYFINPLVNVVLGVVFFRERLRRVQWLAVILALAGVLLMTAAKAQLPWIALTLGLAFGFYGLIRKAAPIEGGIGLSVEILLLLPIAAGYLGYLIWTGQSQFATVDRRTDGLLLFGAVITVFPLFCFGQAARRLPLTSLGFVQYLAPSAQFLLGVFWNREQLNPLEIASFLLIWIGLAVFTFDSVHNARNRNQPAAGS